MRAFAEPPSGCRPTDSWLTVLDGVTMYGVTKHGVWVSHCVAAGQIGSVGRFFFAECCAERDDNRVASPQQFGYPYRHGRRRTLAVFLFVRPWKAL